MPFLRVKTVQCIERSVKTRRGWKVGKPFCKTLMCELVVGLLLLGTFFGSETRKAEAQSPSPRQREETVTETMYEWWLIPWANPQEVACRLLVNHPGRPTGLDVLRFCGEDLYDTWMTTPPCEAAFQGGDVTTCSGMYLYFVGESRVTHQVTRIYPPPTVDLYLEDCTPDFPHFRCPDPVMVHLVGVEPFPEAHITQLTVHVSGQDEVTCAGEECYVPLTAEGEDTRYTLTFSASSSLGDRSADFTATVRLTPRPQGGLLVDVLSDRWADLGVDQCAQAWEVFPPIEVAAEWLEIPETPEALATDVPYLYLGGRLIDHGIVDASSCPDGGLLPNGAASPCGIALAQEEVLAWQNRFDEVIWQAAQEVGVPAVLLKRLFAQESQFWPAEFPHRREVGFGQLSPEGVDTLLLWEPEVAQPLCEEMLGPWRCVYGYAHLSDTQRLVLYQSVWAQANLFCEDCPYGIDLERSDQAVELFAHLIRANCRQIGQTVRNITYRSPSYVSGYEDLWRFTLANYNGPDCTYEALRRTWKAKEPLDWEHVSQRFPAGCEGVLEYVERVAP